MLRLTTRARYGTRFMIDLALQEQGVSVLLKDVAARQDISEGYLEQILPFLRRARLVDARRGHRGGYRLARDPAKITLGEILRALEGELCMSDCLLGGSDCRRADECATRRLWGDVGERITSVLESFSLESIAGLHAAPVGGAGQTRRPHERPEDQQPRKRSGKRR